MYNIKDVLYNNFKGDKVAFNEPMSKHTSFKVGGNADVFVRPTTKDEIEFVVKECKNNNIPFFIIGNGSNLLVTDKGFRGVIIQLYKNYSTVSIEDNIIKAQSGVLLSSIANTALKNNLTGMEFASGIPGTLGGAICMNAGAYGGEIKDIIIDVDVYDNGKFRTITKKEAEFEYRSSGILKHGMIVLSARLKLENGIYDDIKSKMYDFNKQRSEKQPIEYPSAGSTFKRPEGYFAGKLIMDSGLKGYSIGGAVVSQKHCGFIINSGNATAEDILKLIDYTKNVVYNKFNIMLETEVRIIGEK